MALKRLFEIIGGPYEEEQVRAVTVHGTVTDRENCIRHIALSCLAVPGLGCYLFPVRPGTIGSRPRSASVPQDPR